MTYQNQQALGLSFEYFPPNSPNSELRLWQAITKHAAFSPKFVSVTYGAAGSSKPRTLEVLRKLGNETRLPTAGHLTIGGAARAETLATAHAYRASGVNHIVALRGDPPKGQSAFVPHPDGFASSIELIAALHDEGFEVSVGAYPETHPDAKNADADLEFLKRKFDAGADRAITQFFFEKDSYLRFRDRAAAIGIDQPIVPGILPVEDIAKVRNFAKSCGATVPLWMETAFSNAQTEEDRRLLSVSLACDLIANLQAEGVDHVHIYTLNNPDLPADICRALGIEAQIAEAKSVA